MFDLLIISYLQGSPTWEGKGAPDGGSQMFDLFLHFCIFKKNCSYCISSAWSDLPDMTDDFSFLNWLCWLSGILCLITEVNIYIVHMSIWFYDYIPTHPYDIMKDWKCNHDLLIISFTFSDQWASRHIQFYPEVDNFFSVIQAIVGILQV